MSEIILNQSLVKSFKRHLYEEEKSSVTIDNYTRHVREFIVFAGEVPLTKDLTVEYKHILIKSGRYETGSINTILASLNSFCRYLGCYDCTVKILRMQKKTYRDEEKELTKSEYLRLLDAANDQPRLKLIVETICATGIRVSELKYFTVEAIKSSEIVVSCKNKTRTILVPGKLKNKLLKYIKTNGIKSGVIFRTSRGNPVNRSNIWLSMKKLCNIAGVNPSKVFPHNLRRLFARTFYGIERDIVKLADILGHSSINTTRIYIMTTYTEHLRRIERMGLVT